MNPPTTQLQPGSTGAAVTQLQQYLVANGYMTQAQMNSGPGTYGPQTTAAVTKMQQTLGVNNSSGPGYYGPLTIAAAQTKASSSSILTQGTQAGTANPLGQGTAVKSTVGTPATTIAPAASSSSNNTSPPIPASLYASARQAIANGTLTPQGAQQYLQSYINNGTNSGTVNTTTLYAPMQYTNSAGQSVNLNSNGTTTDASASVNSSTTSASTGSTTTSTADSGAIPYSATYGANGGPTAAQWASWTPMQQANYAAISEVGTATQANTGNTTTLAAALAAAAQDPVIIAKYSDALNIDKEMFTQNLQTLQTGVSTQSQTQQMQFESDRLALANQSAAAGQAYSGYRGLAEQNLATTESGIVTSSQAALQKSLNDATSAFEAKYGTAATTAATASFVNPYAASNTSISGLAQTPNTSSTTLTGGIAGGITGTQAPAETADIQAEANNTVTKGQINPVVAASS